MSYFEKTQVIFNQANESALGTLEVSELDFIFQGDFKYGTNTQLWSTGVTSGAGATVDTSSGRLRIQSGSDAAGYAYITSRRIMRYRAGQGTLTRFTPLFTAGIANNIQIWGIGSLSANLPYDGYFFGYNGTSFGLVHYIAGTPTWTAQASWNGDTMNGSGGSGITWDPTKGTPVMIKYPYLGYGNIFFYVQNPTTGAWILVHTIRYANTLATIQLNNPGLQVMGFTLNSGNTTNQTMYLGSVGVAISGTRHYNNPRWATDSNKSGITTENCLLNLKNCTSYNGNTNRGMVRFNSVSFGITTNTLCIVRLKIGVTIGGSPSYATISGTTADQGATITSGNSICSVDVAGTTVTTGTFLFSASCGQTGSQTVDLTSFDLFLAPGEIATWSAFGSASTAVALSVNWSEDV